MPTDIDPVQFGALTAQVKTLETQVEELRADVKALLELANKSKGGFWMGMAVAINTTSTTASRLDIYLTPAMRSNATSFLLLLRNTGTGDNAQFCDIDVEDMTA